MGLAASQARLMMLMQRKSDIQFQVQTVNQRRLTLANASAMIARAMADDVYASGDWTAFGPSGGYAIFPGATAPGGTGGATQTVGSSPIASGTYENQLTVIHAEDKELELRQQQLETEYKCLEAEIDAVEKVIDKSIEKGFKTLG